MPGLRLKVFALDQERQRAANFYVWDSEEAAKAFFTRELRDRVTSLYGVTPSIEFVEIAEMVDNAHSLGRFRASHTRARQRGLSGPRNDCRISHARRHPECQLLPH